MGIEQQWACLVQADYECQALAKQVRAARLQTRRLADEPSIRQYKRLKRNLANWTKAAWQEEDNAS